MNYDDEKLLGAIEILEGEAEDLNASQARTEAQDYYYGRAFGNEIEGRSQVVSRDVADTIEWIKPGLMKIFAGGDEVVRFEPTGPEDVKGAEQETDYTNYVVMQHNNSFLIYNEWFHDALVGRTGYVKALWDEKKDITKETYQGLTEEEYLYIQNDPSCEIVEKTQTPFGWDCVVSREKELGRVKIFCMPPENVRVASTHSSICLQDVDFVEHFEWKTISSLRQEGFDIPDDIAGDDERETETFNRSIVNRTVEQGADINDPSMRLVKVREVWIRYDYDGDGLAELRHVVVVAQKILENEETDLIPIAAITPTVIPHEHTGMSVADSVMDLQLIKSTLMRGFLDNLYLTNNGRYAIDANLVNLDDMLISRPGGVVRVNGNPGQAMMPLVHPSNTAPVLQGIEYIDTVRENRTGVTKYNQGLDSNSLNKTASGINQIMTAAQQRIEMIARTFAETGVRDLYMIVHALIRKHSQKEEIVRLKGEWVPVDPRNWVKRYDMTVSVGLGTGNRDQILAHLMMIYQNQMNSLPLGIATPLNVYNTLARITQNAGFKSTDEFWTNPQKNPPPPSPPDPKVVLDQQKLEFEKQKAGLEAQQAQQDAQFEQQKAAVEIQLQREKAAADIETERTKVIADIQMERQKMLAEIQLKREELAAEIAMHRQVQQSKYSDQQSND